MNKLLIATVLFFTATAASAKTLYYPEKYCSEILSSEYSTGGGDTAIEMFEILCKDSEGNYRAFVTSWGSAAGYFGFGRVFHEQVITLLPYDGEEFISE